MMSAERSVSPPPASVTPVSPVRGARLVSLDAFRGFTMFWIVGGKGMLLALAALLPPVAGAVIRKPFIHTEWAGLQFYDLIWPSFMLMVGVAIPFSFAKRSQTQTRGQMMRSALKRAIVLFLLGSLRESLHLNAPVWFELSSALQPIAVAYLAASLLAGRTIRTQALVAALILAGYACLLAFVSAPGVPAGSYLKDANLVLYWDRVLLGRSEPEGWGTLLCTIPTIATTILGLILGEVLMSAGSARRKAATIGALGVGAVAAGLALSPVIPVIMKLWTTSYGLVSAGCACLLFLPFYWFIDVVGWRRWSFPLVVIGSNAIAIYLGVSIVPFPRIVGIFTKSLASGAAAAALTAVGVVVLEWLILYWMYRRKIFIKA